MTKYFLTIILSLTLVFSGFTISDVFAKQYPALVTGVEVDPYYWPENDFGFSLVKDSRS